MFPHILRRWGNNRCEYWWIVDANPFHDILVDRLRIGWLLLAFVWVIVVRAIKVSRAALVDVL